MYTHWTIVALKDEQCNGSPDTEENLSHRKTTSESVAQRHAVLSDQHPANHALGDAFAVRGRPTCIVHGI